MEKGATRRPLFFAGEVSLAFLAGLLLPALGFLCHCLLSPPSCGFACERAPVTSVAAAWPAHLMPALFASGHLPQRSDSPACSGPGRAKSSFQTAPRPH